MTARRAREPRSYASAILAIGAGRVPSGILFVSPFDPLSFGMAAGVLAVAALVANALPAWRASLH